MNYAASQYQTQSGQYLSSREIEAMAFRHINALMTQAKTAQERHDALHQNQKLWSIFLHSLQRTDCPLEPILQKDLLTLSTWSLRHSNEAMMRPLSLAPLIDINNDMIAGLSHAQQNAVLHQPTGRLTMTS
ncbi:flagellar biosynthesis regulator FlaF [Neokomagataea thailandica]|uniref:Flagellin assembly protein n=1 Tax=Neokomagataea tanensis NBRC 106556 TaxID=1223519 RepID=A0ABQ0QGY9_9PROT|nr:MULTISPECIES: flagellar biosynthesis regulator FlaF [Neokomagataea]GBR44259.1 flagellin assembly protein [Neokomagataea tanensis NBRC 106556]